MTVLVDNVNAAADTWETLFTASTATTIRAFTATNIAENNVSFKAAIVNGDGTRREIINTQIVVRKRAYPGWELVNQDIPNGSTLQFQSSEAGGIHFYVTG